MRGGQGPTHSGHTQSPPDRDGWWGHGCSTGHRRPGTLSSAHTPAQRLKIVQAPNQCKRLIVQIEFRRDGGQSHGRLCLLSKEGGKKRREKTEKRQKRRKRGGGVVVGGRGWWWSPAHSWGGGKDGMAGGGGFAAEAALSGVRPMDLVPLLNLPEPIPESSGVVVLMQHFLESELGGLEQVRVPRPRHELGSTISCHLEGSRGPESSSSALAPSRSKGTETCCVFCSPRYQPRMFRKARRRHICPHRHTRPCHVPLSTSWRPAFGDWHVRPPPPET